MLGARREAQRLPGRRVTLQRKVTGQRRFAMILLRHVDGNSATDFSIESRTDSDAASDRSSAGIGFTSSTGADGAARLIADAFEQHTIRSKLGGFNFQAFYNRIGLALRGKRK